MIMYRLPGLAFLFIIALKPGVYPQASVDSALESLTQVCQAWSEVKGEFKQMAKSAASGRLMEEKGWFAWKRPDHLRWVYEEPEKKDLILNGQYLQFYVEIDCVIYEESDVRTGVYPFIDFVRTCTPDLSLVKLREYQQIKGGERWVFEPRNADESSLNWQEFIIEWYPPDRLHFETRDLLDNRVIYLLKKDIGHMPEESDWEVQFPTTCERLPFGLEGEQNR